uniref:Ubiquitin carboxyl-terminal hydrolase MINDY n=1 Tax=Sphenodon punctatus TaxID=8508 RepID=A0A8D0L277_SPHPU
MDNFYVEEVAASLVREFLNKKGLKKTSAEMDQEFPRTALSINNRNELRKTLHLQSLYKQNKAKESPLKTIIEIMTRYFMEYFGSINCVKRESTPSSATAVLQTKSSHPMGLESSLLKKDISEEETHGSATVSDVYNTEAYRYSPIIHYSTACICSPIPEIKTVLFGSGLCCFSDEWKMQSFTFNDMPPLKYGIVQKKGGPCGVLAAVQACVLQHLIFGDSNRNGETRCLHPSEAHRTKCLALAIATILWRAGSHKEAVVALPSGREHFTPAGKYKADGILETFEIGPYGCILLTFSVILSRSIDHMRNDFDVSTSRLIGAHGYCTQELVNLLLTGKAASNVFNDVIELDSGNGNITILKGISSRSDIGLLSLFEHYDVCQVGCYLKTPNHFSVLFCLRKDLLGDWRTERRFDLYYYDGLANQQEEIRLTVDTTQSYIEDREDGLIPPIEHCIRTK